MDDVRKFYQNCPQPAGPQNIVVRQVVGEGEEQKTVDIHVVIPRRKPAIEQIIDVFVKKLRITDVEVITDKVIVRGDFELKAIYVACLPDQPVHAVEARRIRYTAGIDIRGARRWMEADANVAVEFVDYDSPIRLFWEDEEERGVEGRKPAWQYDDDECDDDDNDHHHKHGKHGHGDSCDEEEYDDHCHKPCKPQHDECDYDDDYHDHHHKPCKTEPDYCDDDDDYDHCKKKCKPCWDPCKCTRHFAATVVLCVNAKVFCDRPIMVNPSYPMMPISPKG